MAECVVSALAATPPRWRPGVTQLKTFEIPLRCAVRRARAYDRVVSQEGPRPSRRASSDSDPGEGRGGNDEHGGRELHPAALGGVGEVIPTPLDRNRLAP